MPNEALYYKCVRNINGSLESCTVYGRITVYKLGQFVEKRPIDGPLAVFNTLNNARQFLIGYNLRHIIYEIYECKILESHERCLYENGGRIIYNLPKGTIFADKVKLIRKIWSSAPVIKGVSENGR